VKSIKIATLVIGFVLAITGARAAAPNYDTSQFIILDGTVKSVDWSGSRLKVLFHSNDGYDGADWTLVGPDPAYLLRMGWTKDLIKPGDQPDVVIHPDKNGTANGSLMRFLLDDYRTLETSPFGSPLIYPRGALSQTYANPADDPLASNYGNTRTCRATNPGGPPGSNYSCRLYVNADHTMMMSENNMQPDGTWSAHIDTGVWWIEKQLGKSVACTLITGSSKPRCHAPVEKHKVGDKWSILFHGRSGNWIEYRELLPGRQ